MAQSANKCSGCKKFPMTMESGMVMCTRCQLSANTVAAWNKFMKPVDLDELVDKLERPIGVLNAVTVLSDDKGLIALAASTLNAIKSLDISEYVLDGAEAERLQKKLEKITNDRQ